MKSSDFTFLRVWLFGAVGGLIAFLISLVPITLIFMADTRPAWLNGGRLELGISVLRASGIILGLIAGLRVRRNTVNEKVKEPGDGS